MSVNFFETNCKEASRNDEIFGLCDDQDQTKAYSDTNMPPKWIATVKNKESKEVSFTPLDKCLLIYKDGTKDEESLCDGMLTFDNSLFFVELKNKEKNWKEESILQLKNTIRLLKEHNPTYNQLFRYKKAYACNRKHPNFAIIRNFEQRKFMTETGGFRLDVNATIKV